MKHRMWLPGEQTPPGAKHKPLTPPGGDTLTAHTSSRGQAGSSALRGQAGSSALRGQGRSVRHSPTYGEISDSRDAQASHLLSDRDSTPRTTSQPSGDPGSLSHSGRDHHSMNQPIFPEDLSQSQVAHSETTHAPSHLASSQLEAAHLASSQPGAAHLASGQLGATQMYLQGLSNSGGHFNMDAVTHPYWGILSKHDGQIF